MSAGEAWVDVERLSAVIDRILVAAQPVKNVGAVAVGHGIIAIDSDRRLVLVDRLFKQSAGSQNKTKVEPRPSAFGTEGNHDRCEVLGFLEVGQFPLVVEEKQI